MKRGASTRHETYRCSTGDRLKKTSNGEGVSHDRPYLVRRWRLANDDEEETVAHMIVKRNGVYDIDSGNTSLDDIVVPAGRKCEIMQALLDSQEMAARIRHAGWPKSTELFAQNMLHLIHFNVFRGFASNKLMLAERANHVAILRSGRTAVNIMEVPASCPIITKSAEGAPTNLLPTEVQRELPHPFWIDCVPFPAMRDNLILYQHQFDHAEFIKDTVGNILDLLPFTKRNGRTIPPGARRLRVIGGREDSMTADRAGFVLWSDSYLIESWEVTPSFLERWGWALQGCEELMSSTNRWRKMRGEAPLRATWEPIQGSD